MRRPFALALLLFAPALMANDLDELVARVMNAYGGDAAWAKVTFFRQTGSVSSPMRPAPGKVTREWQRPDKLRIEVVYPASTEVRVVDGDKGTQNGKEATGMGLDAMRLQAARLALPMLLVEKRSSLRDLDVAQVILPASRRRDRLRHIEIPLTAPMTLTVEVDSETWHIVRSIGKSTGIEFATSYGDFRKVDGLLFPFHEENFAQGTKTAATDIATVELNPVR